MTAYDSQLRQLSGQVARKKQLASILAELRRQRKELIQKVEELEQIKVDEQEDVDRLEGRSLAAFFYAAVGRREDKLTQERQEAYAARVKYDAAVQALAAVEEDLARREEEDRKLEGCQARYRQVLEQKEEALKAAGGPAARELLDLEKKMAALDSQTRELREAISAGQGALAVADEVLKCLDSAGGWATWDLLGGGLIADVAKHSRLDQAQREVERLQVELRRFKTELADVTIQADLQVSVEGFLRFADYFFDGLFVDWAVKDRISRAQEQAESTRGEIARCLTQLDHMLAQTVQAQAEESRRLDQLVYETEISQT